MMEKYPKIDSIFKRDEKGEFTDEYSRPEFEYLKDNTWIFTEKVDGTNIRIIWDCEDRSLAICGRTNESQIPPFLLRKLDEMFQASKFIKFYPKTSMTLYGEGYGRRIQKGGAKYIPDGVSFVLFDVKIDRWWLELEDVHDIAEKLEIDCVPVVGKGTLQEAIGMTKDGIRSRWGDFIMEGLVIKPAVQIFNRMGNRIITKVKHKDFK
ncbi:MAG: hypothetical protein EU547_02580 [Promethearchaeota archaeon]|nr:MAG: hypothetical protein EU547_02580 [Candidatus Lokiarchaeota archaeon]